MNPGLLESDGLRVDRSRLRGPPPSAERAEAAIRALVRTSAASEAASVAMVPLGGSIYFIVETTTGERRRFDEDGRLRSAGRRRGRSGRPRIGEGHAVTSLDLVVGEDAYLLPAAVPGRRPAPVYRVIFDDEDRRPRGCLLPRLRPPLR